MGSRIATCWATASLERAAMAWPCVPDSALKTDSREWLAEEKLNWGCRQQRTAQRIHTVMQAVQEDQEIGMGYA
jgi:hypothetical protein